MLRASVAGLLLLAGAVSDAQAEVRRELIAYRGMPVVVDGSTVNLSEFIFHGTNGAGEIALHADFDPNRTGLFLGPPSDLKLVVEAGDPAPGIGGVFDFARAPEVTIQKPGELLFASSVTPSPKSNSFTHGIWIAEPGQELQTLAYYNGPTPVGNGTFTNFSSIGRAVNGELAFGAMAQGADFVTGTGNNTLWAGQPGNFALLAERGQAAPGAPAGETFTSFGSPLRVTKQGNVAFLSVLGTSTDSIWFSKGGDLQLVAREGSPAPGGAAFGDLAPLNATPAFDTNGQGHIAFPVKLQGDGYDATNSTTIFAGAPGSLSPVVKATDAIPGVPAGHTLRGVGAVLLDEHGNLAFSGFYSPIGGSTFTTGIWTIRDGTTRLIAQGDQPAPDLPEGISIDSVRLHATNDAGYLVFSARLEGSGTNVNNNYALYLVDPSGTVHLVTRSGDTYETPDGEVHTLKLIGLGGPGNLQQFNGGVDAQMDGNRMFLTDDGRLLYDVKDLDSGGNITADAVLVASVPEPTGGVLLGLASVLALRGRHRRNAQFSRS